MIEDVSAWSIVDIEAEGSDAKEWLADPHDDRWLCKPAVTPENGVQQGEDWSEWLAADVAMGIAVPHATIRTLLKFLNSCVEMSISSRKMRPDSWPTRPNVVSRTARGCSKISLSMKCL